MIYVTDNNEYNVWRENFLGVFRQISTDEEFKTLASNYPYENYSANNCKQRKSRTKVQSIFYPKLFNLLLA